MKKFLVKVKEFFVKVFESISDGLGFVVSKIEYGAEFIWKNIVKLFVIIKGVYFSEKFKVVRVVLYYVLLIFIFVWIYKQFDKFVKKRWHNATFIQKRALTGYLFISPWIIGFLALVLYPFGKVVFMSFNIVNQFQTDYTYKWVGFQNFDRVLFIDIDFVIELQNFIVRVLLYSPVIIALSIIIAMLLNQDVKGKGLFRMVFCMPASV